MILEQAHNNKNYRLYRRFITDKDRADFPAVFPSNCTHQIYLEFRFKDLQYRAYPVFAPPQYIKFIVEQMKDAIIKEIERDFPTEK